MESPHSNLLPEVDSLPDGFVDGAADEQNRDDVDVPIEKAEKPRTFPVPLSEETDCKDEEVVDDVIKASSKLSLEQKESSPPPPTLSEGSTQNPNLCKDSTQSVDSVKPRKQEAVESSKLKSSKNVFKSEKEFLEFMLKYQQVLSERDSAVTVRDKLESLCRELQRQNKLLMWFGDSSIT
ncbi:unnamed protein product [Eruca vesicaria subsp. sativa]|uniref:Uncharacterized protein n=1 Tax=Eruca vesicaria subsp. sativa TaxID=29727 RepID=A0ABC8JMP6_ERUVS|nr:unnamed protein product [Eruca vesicaria subsp. sativa]